MVESIYKVPPALIVLSMDLASGNRTGGLDSKITALRLPPLYCIDPHHTGLQHPTQAELT